jgi:glutathione S-transferase
MTKPTVYGPSYSTYVRSVRLALEEKGAAYDLVDVAMLGGAHKDLSLYETSAILRYVDRALPGPALQPKDAKAAARVDQALSIVDSFGYPCMIGQLVWQRAVVPMQGGKPDEAVVAAALPQIKLCGAELARLLGNDPWFGGGSISLADLHLAPVFAYVAGTPEGGELLAGFPNLKAWWGRMAERPSMAKTPPQFS